MCICRPMCLYVCAYMYACMYVCVYMYACMYVYVCICMMYACIYVYMHSCIFVSSSSPTAMGSAPVGVRCQFHQLPPTFSLRSHLCIFVYVCIIIICLGGNVRWENVLLKTGGGIVRGRIVRRGIVRGIIVLHSDRRLPNFRFVRITAKSPRVHG